MPIRKTSFYENGFYHVYNRGVEKRDIFLDEKDYQSFLGILKAYLFDEGQNPNPNALQGPALQSMRIRKHSLAEDISLVAYCLMPNHFHFLLQQRTSSAVTKFMQRVLTAYSMYFNKHYDRVGSLFQGRFQAKEISKDEYLLHLTRYIHRNPVEAKMAKIQNLEKYKWSSYQNYLGLKEGGWVKSKAILDYFSSVDNKGDYKNFVEFDTEEDKLPNNLYLDS